MASVPNSLVEQIINGSYLYRFSQDSEPSTTSPTGKGENISLFSDSSATTLTESARTSAAVTITLSPEASAALARSEVAVALLSDGKLTATTSEKTETEPKQPTTTTGQAQTAGMTTATTSTDSDDNDSDVSDAQYIADLQNTLATNGSEVWSAYVKEFGGPTAIMNFLDSAQTSSFVAATESGSLVVQDATDRPELDISQTANFSGGVESTSISENDSVLEAEDAANNTYTEVLHVLGVGALVISWSQDAAVNASETSASTVASTVSTTA